MARWHIWYVICFPSDVSDVNASLIIYTQGQKPVYNGCSHEDCSSIVVILSALLCAEGAYMYTSEGLPLPSVSYGNFMYREMESTVQKTSESFLALDIFTSQAYVECVPVQS